MKNYLPDSVKYFPDEDLTNTTIEFRVSELIREKVLRLTEEEVPHAVTCVVEEYIDKKDKAILLLHTDNLNALIDALIKNEIVIVPPEEVYNL